MVKYEEVETEELKRMLKQSEREEDITAFNSSRLRSKALFNTCFIKAELLRRNEIQLERKQHGNRPKFQQST